MGSSMDIARSPLHAIEALGTPEHLREFSLTSIALIEQLHSDSLELPNADVVIGTPRGARWAKLERKNLPWTHRDYETIAIFLGERCLSVSLEHRHEQSDTYENPTAHNSRSVSLVLEQGRATLFHSNITRMGADERITNNEEAADEMTRRLHHAIATIGIEQTALYDEYPLLKAS